MSVKKWHMTLLLPYSIDWCAFGMISFKAKGQQVLSEQDQLIAGDCEDDQQKDMDTSKASHMEGVLSSIQECKISSNSDSLRKLGCKFQYRNVSIHTNSFPFHSMQQNAHRICTCSRSSPVQQDCFVLLWLKAGLRYSLPSSFWDLHTVQYSTVYSTV